MALTTRENYAVSLTHYSGQSKKAARKARERQQPAGMDRTPTTDNAGAKVAGRGDDFSPVQQPQISEAAKGQAEEVEVVQPAAATEVLETLSREEQIEALKNIVKRLESDVAGAQVAYQTLTADQKKYKKQIANLEMEITAEQVRGVEGCTHWFLKE